MQSIRRHVEADVFRLIRSAPTEPRLFWEQRSAQDPTAWAGYGCGSMKGLAGLAAEPLRPVMVEDVLGIPASSISARPGRMRIAHFWVSALTKG